MRGTTRGKQPWKHHSKFELQQLTRQTIGKGSSILRIFFYRSMKRLFLILEKGGFSSKTRVFPLGFCFVFFLEGTQTTTQVQINCAKKLCFEINSKKERKQWEKKFCISLKGVLWEVSITGYQSREQGQKNMCFTNYVKDSAISNGTWLVQTQTPCTCRAVHTCSVSHLEGNSAMIYFKVSVVSDSEHPLGWVVWNVWIDQPTVL